MVATDNDQGGRALAAEAAALAPVGAQVKRQTPEIGKDWNDQVKAEAELAASYRFRYPGMVGP